MKTKLRKSVLIKQPLSAVALSPKHSAAEINKLPTGKNIQVQCSGKRHSYVGSVLTSKQNGKIKAELTT